MLFPIRHKQSSKFFRNSFTQILWSNAIFPPLFLFRCYDYDMNRLHGQILKFKGARFGISEKWLLLQKFQHRYDMNNEDINRPRN